MGVAPSEERCNANAGVLFRTHENERPPFFSSCLFPSPALSAGRLFVVVLSLWSDLIGRPGPRTATIVHGEIGHIACCLECARILQVGWPGRSDVLFDFVLRFYFVIQCQGFFFGSFLAFYVPCICGKK